MKNMRVGLALCLATTGLGLAAPVATAAEVAPGAPMKIYLEPEEGSPLAEAPQEFLNSTCSQGLPGTVTLEDGTRKDVLISVAHCLVGEEQDSVTLKPEVYARTPEGDKLIAVREHGEEVPGFPDDLGDIERLRLFFDTDDAASAELVEGVHTTRVADSVDQYGQSHGEPVTLTGIRDYPALGPWQVSFDNFGQPICKDGQTTGRTCGVQLMRTQNSLWSLNEIAGGDSGGIQFDPETGEALAMVSYGLSFSNMLSVSQPIDRTIEQLYGVPDGQVNERFALPESTEGHDPVRVYEEEKQQKRQWAEENLEEEEPATPAGEIIEANTQEAVEETVQWAEDSTQRVWENPAELPAVVADTQEVAQHVAALTEENIQAGLGLLLGEEA
ncbi:hypothetical protein [Corynebacterium oculi]|uniref:Trypsin n=1 Tax=Corynebacterium oculi TaxID=1544416 RepID=A0A0Q0UBT1_9CORY|nr:hypothetical protein [Corynebacterium oculi]KQB85358.1 hypothetical protein Cocul_00497 [Corynebacterium oculi]